MSSVGDELYFWEVEVGGRGIAGGVRGKQGRSVKPDAREIYCYSKLRKFSVKLRFVENKEMRLSLYAFLRQSRNVQQFKSCLEI